MLILLSGEITNKKCNCGKANEGPVPLIAGGEKAGLDEFPWIVLVTLDALSLTPFLGFFCTGALLDPTHVLTAAHCVWHYSAHQLMVILASNNKRNIHPQHVAVNVTRIHAHPSYNDDTYLSGNQWNQSDVAVLTLAAPVQYSHKIRPICLPASPGRDYGGSIAVAAGFGLVDVSDGPEKAKNYLMKNVETLHSDEECMMYECPLCGVRCIEKGRIPPRCAHMMDNVNILCSHEPGTTIPGGHTIRQGDSGSALNLKENGRFVRRLRN